MQIVIDIPNEDYEYIKDRYDIDNVMVQSNLIASIMNGKTLPKGHGRLIDETEILRFLKCPEYENCDWRNCYDCNQRRCINLNDVNCLVSIIDAESEEVCR